MVCLNLKFGTGHNFPFSGKDHGLYSPLYFVENRLNTSSKRPLSKLSKINVI